LRTKELYHSSNGDRWYLARDPDTGRVFVKHQANLPSGGHVEKIEVGVFLSQGEGPEQQELLQLLGASVDESRGYGKLRHCSANFQPGVTGYEVVKGLLRGHRVDFTAPAQSMLDICPT
jgi:hypothetical protein